VVTLLWTLYVRRAEAVWHGYPLCLHVCKVADDGARQSPRLLRLRRTIRRVRGAEQVARTNEPKPRSRKSVRTAHPTVRNHSSMPSPAAASAALQRHGCQRRVRRAHRGGGVHDRINLFGARSTPSGDGLARFRR
jgi:hypothetical protein